VGPDKVGTMENKPMQIVNIRMTTEQIEFLRRKSPGNVSQYLRLLVQKAMQEEAENERLGNLRSS